MPAGSDRIPRHRHGRPRAGLAGEPGRPAASGRRCRAWPRPMSACSWSTPAAASPPPTRRSPRSCGGRTSPILLLANKCEGRLAESQAAEAWSLGLGEPLPVSGRAWRRHPRSAGGTASPISASRSATEPAPIEAEAAAAPAAPGGDRPAQCRQIVAGQPADRRGADADRPRARPDPRQRIDPAELAGPRRSSWSTRRACAARPASTPSWRSCRPPPRCARSSSPTSWR